MNLNFYFINQIKSQRNKIIIFPPNGMITVKPLLVTELTLHRAGDQNHVVRKDYLEVKIIVKIWV